MKYLTNQTPNEPLTAINVYDDQHRLAYWGGLLKATSFIDRQGPDVWMVCGNIGIPLTCSVWLIPLVSP